MRFRNLPAQRQADARATGFGREKWNEQIRRVHDAGPGVSHKYFDAFGQIAPARCYCPGGFERGFRRIMQNVDE